MLNRERKHFRLKQSRSPALHPFLSGVAVIHLLDGVKLCYIRFSSTFVDYVGLQLPEGVGPGREAYIKVVQLSENDWIVAASYVSKTRAKVLWVTDKRPAWVKGLFDKQTLSVKSIAKSKSNGVGQQ